MLPVPGHLAIGSSERNKLVHVELRVGGPAYSWRRRNDLHALPCLPWSVCNALFCSHELVASSLLRADDLNPRLRRLFLSIVSRTVVMALSGDQTSLDHHARLALVRFQRSLLMK